MGWCGGSNIANSLILSVRKNFPDATSDQKRAFFRDLIETLEQDDWDTQDESIGLDADFDEVMYGMYPDWERRK